MLDRLQSGWGERYYRRSLSVVWCGLLKQVGVNIRARTQSGWALTPEALEARRPYSGCLFRIGLVTQSHLKHSQLAADHN